ncbi:MAG: DUF1844 domain-containing protein [Nitrospinota bacterium]|nr:DUF1844 domain-containing protein [Nitrospinota bacterium]
MEEKKGFSTNDRRGTLGDKLPVDEPDFDLKREENQKDKGGAIKIDFSTFILSMSSSVFLHFGEIPNPETGVKEKNLPVAKQTIDIISMLQEKTKGNLSDDENKLLENILYELRMRYMELVKA